MTWSFACSVAAWAQMGAYCISIRKPALQNITSRLHTVRRTIAPQSLHHPPRQHGRNVLVRLRGRRCWQSSVNSGWIISHSLHLLDIFLSTYVIYMQKTQNYPKVLLMPLKYSRRSRRTSSRPLHRLLKQRLGLFHGFVYFEYLSHRVCEYCA